MESDAFADIPAGSFTMGADDAPHPEDGESPAREVCLRAYRIATRAVSVRDFAHFVTRTAYETTAEKMGGSLVFKGQLCTPDAHPAPSAEAPWWHWVAGASWRNPVGGGQSEGHLPVVHIALADAAAYCEWSGTRLPTEAQWERAAQPRNAIAPHIWQGRFPDAPKAPPGPVSVEEGDPNGFGLVHACGNVWEWTADRFTRLHSPRMTNDPTGPLNGEKYVVKGGSFLCCPSYCARFRPSSRRAEWPDATTSHLGFRVAGSCGR